MTPICRHIRTNGERCGSPALRGQERCFFHHRDHLRRSRTPPPESTEAAVRREVQAVLHRHGIDSDLEAHYFGYIPTPPSTVDLPTLEDAGSVQLAISRLVLAIANGQLDPKLAGPLLYGLQLASHNLRNLNPDTNPVTDITHDTTTGEPLAKEPSHEINNLPATQAE